MNKTNLFLSFLSLITLSSCKTVIEDVTSYVYFSNYNLNVEDVINYYAENDIELTNAIKSNQDNKFLITYKNKYKESINNLSVDYDFSKYNNNFTFTDEQGNILFEDSSIYSLYFKDIGVEITISDTSTFYEVTNELVGQNMMLWLSYVKETESYIGDIKSYNGFGTQEEKQEAEDKILVNSKVNEAIDSDKINIVYSSKYDAETLNKLYSNEICYYIVK